MFIVNLTYIKPLDTVEKFLEKHIDFLNQYYTKGIFNTSKNSSFYPKRAVLFYDRESH